MVVDLDVWRDLRAQVEQRWLSGAPPSGSAECGTNDPNAYVACKGPYLVHLGDPGINPPNLAAAQELSDRDLPGRRCGRRDPKRSSGSTTSGCPVRSRRPARRSPSTPGSSRPTSAA